MNKKLIAAISLISAITMSSVHAKTPPSQAPTVILAYADIADRALASDVVAVSTVTKATHLDQKRFSNVPSGAERVLLVGRITTLIRGPENQPQDIEFLADIPMQGNGRLPKLKNRPFIIFGDRVNGAANQLQLIDRHSLLLWSSELESRTRDILIAANAPGAAPRINRIGQIFSVAGSIAGENETQIFLESYNGRPVSLSILRRPGETPRWIVSLDEVVDEAAPFPARDSLTWYRLACTLPMDLPPQTIDDLEAPAGQMAKEDYRLVMQQLGTCQRTLPLLAASLR